MKVLHDLEPFLNIKCKNCDSIILLDKLVENNLGYYCNIICAKQHYIETLKNKNAAK